jgi:large subunit ribosomal protein L19
MKTEAASFNVGDTVRVHAKIVEGAKERIQIFEGIVIAIDGKGINKTFTVRKISFEIGVERVFPLYSPKIANIETIRKGKIRRAKLYFLRERKGKSAKLKEKRIIKPPKQTAAKITEKVIEQVTEKPTEQANV